MTCTVTVTILKLTVSVRGTAGRCLLTLTTKGRVFSSQFSPHLGFYCTTLGNGAVFIYPLLFLLVKLLLGMIFIWFVISGKAGPSRFPRAAHLIRGKKDFSF